MHQQALLTGLLKNSGWNKLYSKAKVNCTAKKEVKAKKIDVAEKLKESKCACRKGGMGGAYFLGFISAAVYFISNSVGFWAGVVGFLKAIVCPGFVVYGLLKFSGL